MSVELNETFLFIFYEVLIFLTSFRIQYHLLNRNIKDISHCELIITWLGIGIILSLAISIILSFIQYNGLIQYLVISSILFTVTHIDRKSELKNYFKYLIDIFNKISEKIFDWKIIIMILIILPLMITIMKPIGNSDSILFLNFILDWRFNDSTPYFRYWEYVPTWEISYLPQLIITNSDNFFWLNSFKAIIIVALGSYLISRKIGLTKELSLMLTFSGIVFFLFWWHPSGQHIGTLKNYTIATAGLILISFSILKMIQIDYNRLSGVLLIIGFIFITIRYSSVLIIIFSVILFILFNKRSFFKNKKLTITWGLIGILLIFSINGHYYLNNYIEFGNPFYPLNVNVGEINLPGPVDVSGTSIASHLDNKKIWDNIFSLSKIENAGILFPVTFSFGFLGTFGIICYSVWKKISKRGIINYSILFLSIFLLLNWFLYVNTPLSATNLDMIFSHIHGLTSLKYIEAIVILTEILFIYFLHKIGVSTKILLLIIGINSLSKLFILYSVFPQLDYSFFIIPMIFFIGISLLKLKKQIPMIIPLSVIIILVFVFSPYVIEAQREQAWARWYDVTNEIHNLSPQEIYLVNQPSRALYNVEEIGDHYKYLFYGSKFQHSIITTSDEELSQKLENDIDFKPPYIIKSCPYHMPCKNHLEIFVEKLKPYGYEIKAEDDRAILLHYVNEKLN